MKISSYRIIKLLTAILERGASINEVKETLRANGFRELPSGGRTFTRGGKGTMYVHIGDTGAVLVGLAFIAIPEMTLGQCK